MVFAGLGALIGVDRARACSGVGGGAKVGAKLRKAVGCLVTRRPRMSTDVSDRHHTRRATGAQACILLLHTPRELSIARSGHEPAQGNTNRIRAVDTQLKAVARRLRRHPADRAQ